MDKTHMLNVLLALATALLCVTMVTARDSHTSSSGVPRRNKNRNFRRRSEKPNIVFIITDDQDSELGSMNYMPKTLRYLQDEGAHFHNAFVTTPMCCPSRSSMLTGMYVHNHNTYTNNANCSSIYWQQHFEARNFGTYLKNAGYSTGYFGKYLNEYQGTYIPPGWTEWMGLIRNSRFYNYTLNFNGKQEKHGFEYHKDYLTDLIANDSVTFLKLSKQYYPDRPVAMVLSVPAPHGPEDSAPQHSNMFFNVTTHRTPSWNYAPNADKQWLLQHTGKMEPIHIQFTDLLQTKRLQTLQAVDDAVEKVYNELKELGELDNTYIVYTSDHGYHLGQYGLIKGKALPYEFDIRVPFYMRGPKIPAGVRVPNIALNIDLAPTFLDIAGVEIPEHMDGRSLLTMFDDDLSYENGNNLKRKKAWRDTFLVERGKISNKKIKERARIEANNNPQQQLDTKDERLERNCQKAEYQSPCSPTQEWECRRKADGSLRMYKCRGKGVYQLPREAYDDVISRDDVMRGVISSDDVMGDGDTMLGTDDVMRGDGDVMRENDDVMHGVDDVLGDGYDVMRNDQPVECVCGQGRLSKSEKRRQQQFLQEHVNNENFKPKFIRTRLQRDVDERFRRRDQRNRRTTGFKNNGHGAAVCTVLANTTVVCSRNVYSDRRRWRKQRKQVDDTIADLKNKLDSLRDIKDHLKDSRPQGQSTVGSHADWLNTMYSTDNDQSLEPRQSDQPSDSRFNTQSDVDIDLFRDDDRFSRRQNRRKDRNKGQRRPNENSVEDMLPVEEDSYDWPKSNEQSQESPKINVFTETVEVRDSETDYDDDIGYDYYIDGDESPFDPQDYEDEEGYESSLEADDVISECDCDGMLMDERDVVQLEREERRKIRKQEILERKEAKKAEREHNRLIKQQNREHDESSEDTEVDRGQNRKDINPTRDCSSPSMKCFEHDNDHWRTAPFWTAGPFCFCPNSNNNTYSCLRTINETHNFLYCEFITGFINYYDMTRDPYQLRNAVRDLSYAMLQHLHNTLERMKTCKGARECTLRTRNGGTVEEEGFEAATDGSGDLIFGSGDIDTESVTIFEDVTGTAETASTIESLRFEAQLNDNASPDKSQFNDVISVSSETGNRQNGNRVGTGNEQRGELVLELGEFPIPGRAAVVIETDGSGDETSFDEIARDSRKERFLYLSNLFRLDTTFLSEKEIEKLISFDRESSRETIPDSQLNEHDAKNVKGISSQNSAQIVGDNIDNHVNVDYSGENWNEIDNFPQDIFSTYSSPTESSKSGQYSEFELEFIKHTQDDAMFAGPPVQIPPSFRPKHRHKHNNRNLRKSKK